MVIGVSMIKVMPGRERSVYHAVKGINGVQDVYHIFGEYDFFIILEAEGLNKLNQLVGEVQAIREVIEGRTIIVGLKSCLQEHEPMRVLA